MAEDAVRRPQRGLVTVFTGDGKGKTTAAIGTAIRAAGYGLQVYIIFFLKGKMFRQGEAVALEESRNIRLASFGQQKWVKKDVYDREANEQAAAALDFSREVIYAGKHDLVILDELNNAVDLGLVPVNAVIDIIRGKPSHVDLIVTGRNAHPDIIRMADTVTEMVNIKHAFENGVAAREGFDY